MKKVIGVNIYIRKMQSDGNAHDINEFIVISHSTNQLKNR